MEIFNSIHSVTRKYDNQVEEIMKNRVQNNMTQVNKSDEDFKNMDKEKLKKELQKVAEELNRAMNPLNIDLKFEFNNKVDELVVKVIDKKTDNVIREFPPKEALKLMEKMRELVGMLFDKKG
ncbi:flagellar protein FlaG [Caminibacter sp.]